MQASRLLKKQGVWDQFEIHPLQISSSSIHIMFSKQSCTQADVNKCNNALKQLKKNAQIQSVIRKYIQ